VIATVVLVRDPIPRVDLRHGRARDDIRAAIQYGSPLGIRCNSALNVSHDMHVGGACRATTLATTTAMFEDIGFGR